MKFEELKFIPTNHLLWSKRARVNFPNGYGANITAWEGTFTNNEYEYELDVLKDGVLCYDTPVSDDVMEILSKEEAENLLTQIEGFIVQHPDDKNVTEEDIQNILDKSKKYSHQEFYDYEERFSDLSFSTEPIKWNVGDKLRRKLYPPPIAKVIKVHPNGQITVRWPSGLEAIITRPDEIEKVEE